MNISERRGPSMSANDNLVARACAPVVRVLAIACGYNMLALSVLIGFNIVTRKLFNFSLGGGDELGGYGVAILAACGFSYALVERVHTRIDLIYKNLPPSLRAIFSVLAMLAMFCFAIFIAWRAFDALRESIAFGSRATTPLQTPLWIPQAAWFGGLAIFAVVSGVLASHAVWLLVYDRQVLLRHYGPQTLEEEVAQETMQIEGLDVVDTLPGEEKASMHL